MNQMVIRYQDRSEEFFLGGRKVVIRELRELESFLLANYKKDRIHIAFNSNWASGPNPISALKTDVLSKIYITLQSLYFSMEDEIYPVYFDLFPKFYKCNFLSIFETLFKSLIPPIYNKAYIEQLYNGENCRTLHDDLLDKLSKGSDSKYTALRILNSFDTLIDSKIFTMTENERFKLRSEFSEKTIDLLFSKTPQEAFIIGNIPDYLAIDEPIIRHGQDDELADAVVNVYIERISTSAIFIQEKMEQSRKIIEEYIPLYHEIYLSHYHSPYPFANPFLKSIVMPPPSSSIDKKPLHNNIIALNNIRMWRKNIFSDLQ